MSQRENIEACLVKHNQAFASVHEKFTEQLNAESGEALSQALKTITNYLEIDHMEQLSKTKSAFDKLARTLHETGIAVYDATRQSLQHKEQEIATLREEYERELRAKDEEIKTLTESVHDLRENRRDKDEMLATTKELNKSLINQLQERKELHESKEEKMRLSMDELKREAELRLQNKEAEFRKDLAEAHRMTHAKETENRKLSEKLELGIKTIDE